MVNSEQESMWMEYVVVYFKILPKAPRKPRDPESSLGYPGYEAGASATEAQL
jgi:hypothetical protein